MPQVTDIKEPIKRQKHSKFIIPPKELKNNQLII